MVSAFDITTSSPEIEIKKQQRSAKVVFIVSSNLVQPRVNARGMLVLVDPPEGPHVDWLRFETPEDRGCTRFQAPEAIECTFVRKDDGTTDVKRYPVEVNVPVGAPGGAYLFQLKMLDAENPSDETVTYGPTVTLRVAAAEPELPKKKPFPLWIILAALGVLALIIGLVIFWPRRVEVPDVIGRSETDARATVTAAGLAFEKTAEKSSEEPVGNVLATTPQAGERVGKATPVFYVLSAPPIDLPGTPLLDRVAGLPGQSLEQIYGGQCSRGFVHSSFDIKWRVILGEADVLPIGWVDPNNEHLCAIRVLYRFLVHGFGTNAVVDVRIIIKQVSE